ncbi:carbohydrate esterase family 3 protein [Zasmidium cellare ATCC 36951]|uniref:Carbohydrate esterase family 3 protein n=1 Tax=Zasmidium cellare ATCC 36951 TaxID=1080233 RepID=A0A6A6C7W3_ZASCE|nr:carbohydrate esterase family 3 protein [Zasmidium cellare ATCC 36951]KAF2162338.1 carbohydrate esterase family 3 protein [Zasmidium cellare ATCC 36951]
MLRLPSVRNRVAITFLVFVAVLLLYTGYGWYGPSLRRQKPLSAKLDKVPLRLLPLGDSITEGRFGQGNNGYRLNLRNQLLQSGYTVDFIGSLSDGEDNPDGEHEGHGGFHIKEIQAKILENGILNQHPNLILLHAGSNDLTWLFGWLPPQDPYEETPQRFESLLDTILCECPDAVLLMGQIVDNKEYNASQRIQGFNKKVEIIAEQRRASGFKVQAVDHFGVSGDLIQPDFIHPTDGGYEHMANQWFHAIQNLPADWIQPAREPGLDATENCKAKVPS